MAVALRRWTAPGWYRAVFATLLAAAFALGLVVLLRELYGYEPLMDWDAIVTVMLISAPLGFLVGIGCFDYWFYWAAGKPTRPEDHSGHGAYSWRDYFRVNTDHKVIGIQYIVTTVFFFFSAKFVTARRDVTGAMGRSEHLSGVLPRTTREPCG
jgi:cytochrome c oxidase subunit 1